MNCDAHQDRILDYEQLTTDERQSVDTHLRACPQCREAARQWRALDAALARQLRAPAVSANFDARLHERIAREATVAKPADMAARRNALNAEYANARQQRDLWRWIPRVLDVAGCGVLGGLGGWLAVRLLTRVGDAWTAAAPTGVQTLILGSVAGVVIALGVAMLTLSRPLRQALR